MNVIVANEQHSNLMNNLDIDIIKSLSGIYDSNEIVDMFKSFFYSRMIMDVTALKQNDNIQTYSTLVKGLDPSKIIFLLPQGSKLCTPSFLSKLIDLGIYNFTTNFSGILYLFNKPNTLKDVEHIKDLEKKRREEAKKREEEVKHRIALENNLKIIDNSSLTSTTGFSPVTESFKHKSTIIGIRNLTEHAGATTLIYMIKKELGSIFGSENVVAIEINKKDFGYFNEKNMVSSKAEDIKNTLEKYSAATFILVDLNDCTKADFCNDILYLIEPSIVKLSKLIRRDKDIFSQLSGKKVLLNKSLITNSDVSDFEHEAGIKIFYNMPALDERKRNAIINDFLSKLGVLSNDTGDTGASKIFGLFRR